MRDIGSNIDEPVICRGITTDCWILDKAGDGLDNIGLFFKLRIFQLRMKRKYNYDIDNLYHLFKGKNIDQKKSILMNLLSCIHDIKDRGALINCLHDIEKLSSEAKETSYGIIAIQAFHFLKKDFPYQDIIGQIVTRMDLVVNDDYALSNINYMLRESKKKKYPKAFYEQHIVENILNNLKEQEKPHEIRYYATPWPF